MESLGMRRGLYKVIRQPVIAIIALISHEEGKKPQLFYREMYILKIRKHQVK